MKQTKLIMGMPITLEILDTNDKTVFNRVFSYFRYIDKKFSTYKKDSEISKINRGEIEQGNYSKEMRQIFKLSEITKVQTSGYFNIYRKGYYDPSGTVKGWAIYNAHKLIKNEGIKNYYIDAGGDVQVSGKNKGKFWTVGIKNPFNQKEIVKKLLLYNKGIATSGNYIRGDHIYNPKSNKKISNVVSLTIIGPNVYEADRFATAAFAMGTDGIGFIENLNKLEGYMIDKNGIATMTSGFEKYVS